MLGAISGGICQIPANGGANDVLRTARPVKLPLGVSLARPFRTRRHTRPPHSPEGFVDTAKLRWRIERDYEELEKSELGLAHFAG